MMQTLNLIEILNPFKPNEQKRSVLEFRTGASIEDIYPQMVTGELAIGLNGKIIVREERALTFLAEGDYLVLCPIIEGGSGGKSILRIVALIALVYFSGGLAAGAYGAMGGTYVMANAGIVTAMMAGGVVMVGGLMINALLPAPEPHKNDKTSPTYGLDGAKNTAAEGIPTPICYGTFRMAGNIIDNYVVNDGATQWLYMLINAGEGQVSAITDIQLNELAIDTFQVATTPFKDVEWVVQLGTTTQLPIPWFQTTVTPQNIGFRLIPGWKLMTTLGKVDQIRVDFSCPAGIFYANDDGSTSDSHVPIEIQYRVLGTTAWSPLVVAQGVTAYTETITWMTIRGFDSFNTTTSSVYVPTGAEYRTGNIYYLDTPNGDGTTLHIQVGTVTSVASYSASVPTIQTNSRSAVRRSVMSTTLPNAQYEVQVHRTNAEQQLTDAKNIDTCYVTDLNDIVFAQIGYRNTALVALKARLGDLLTGLPNVTYLNHGKMVNVWNDVTNLWEFRSSANPAWVSLDVLSNKRYGGGAAMSRFDLVAWKDWARYCDANSLQFNGVFDTASNVWDSVQAVMRCGHASIVRIGTRYSIAIERAADPVMMFSVANMLKGSFEEIWHSTVDRANEIEGTFFDKDNYNNYKPKTIKVYDTAALAAGQPQRTTTVNLMGVTSAQQAWTDLNIMMNMNRYIQRTVKFSASMEALGCTVGSVVIVQHDMPQWGVGGRLDAGSSNSVLVLDREVTMVFGTTYKALVHHSAVQSYAGTVSAIVSTTDTSSVILNGFDGVTTPDRMQVNGQDVQVFGTFTSGAQHGVTVNLITGVASGAAYTLWNVDVIETCNVVNLATSGTPIVGVIVQLASPLAAAPAQFTNFMFGETAKVAKPFRVKAISGTHDYHRDLTCIEYNATVYNAVGAVPTANYSTLPMYVSQVTINGVSESMVPHGLSYQSQVTVTYNSAQQTYQRSTVYLSRNGDAFTRIGSDVYSVMVIAAQGEQLTFQVVAQDVLGKSAPQSSAPTITYNVQGKTTLPGAIQALAYTFDDTGIAFNFTAPTEQDWLTSQGSTTPTFTAGTLIFDAKATAFHWPFQTAGTYPLYFHSIIQGHLASAMVSASVVVLPPATPTINSAQILGGVLMLQWTDAKTSQVIRHYRIRLGPVGGTFATATDIALAPRTQTTFSIVIPTEGTQVAYVRAEDMAGNFSTVATTTVVINTTSNLTLLSDSQVIRVAKDGTITPTTINLTATFTGALTGSIANFTNNRGITLGGTNNARTLASASLGANTSVAITASFTSPGGTVYTDTITAVVLNEGSDAISMLLSNDALSIASANDGTVISLAGASTTATVYHGAVVDTTNWTISKVDTNLTSSISGYTVSLSAVSADAAYCDITMARSGYTSITKRFSVAKSKQGAAGTNGTNGTNGTGTAGARGTVTISYATTGSSWVNSIATTAISSSGYGVPQMRDVVTLYNSSVGYSETRFYDSGALVWTVVTQVIDGSLLVTGTVAGNRLIANTVDATRIDSRGLSIKDAAGNIILAAGTALDFNTRFGANTTGMPANNATVGANWATNVTGAPAVNSSINNAAGENIWTGSLAAISGSLSGYSITNSSYPDARGTNNAVVVTIPTSGGHVYWRVLQPRAGVAGWYTVTMKFLILNTMSIVMSTTDAISWNNGGYARATTASASPVWVSCTLRQYVAAGAGLDVVVGSFLGTIPAYSTPASTAVAISDLFIRREVFAGDLNATYGATWGSGGNVTGSAAVDTSITTAGTTATYTGISGTPGANIANSAVSIGANGTLSGAGGGSATIAGMDNTIVRSGFPITSGNITTYISGLAVGTAQIANLAVNTLQIAGNAVTVPDFAISSAVAGSSGFTWATILTSSSIPIGVGTVCINIALSSTPSVDSYDLNGAPVYVEVSYRLLSNGSVIASWSGYKVTSDLAYSLSDTPSAAVTYQLQHIANSYGIGGGGTTGRRTMLCLGVKK